MSRENAIERLRAEFAALEDEIAAISAGFGKVIAELEQHGIDANDIPGSLATRDRAMKLAILRDILKEVLPGRASHD